MNKSAIRFIHVSPDIAAVDIYLNQNLFIQDLAYEEITEYSEFEPDEYHVTVFRTGETTNPLIDDHLAVSDREVMIVAVNGTSPNVNLMPTAQSLKCPPPNQAMLRFIHLSPDIAGLDVVLADNTILISGMEYQQVSDYLPLKAGTYDLRFRPSGLDSVVLEVFGIHLKSEQLYTIVTTGRLEGQPDLKIITVLDTSTYCVQEMAGPRRPDARSYNWESKQIKLHYR
ncbi:MAG: DUF4397 domain-containing protein [Methylocystaceae bacterium]